MRWGFGIFQPSHVKQVYYCLDPKGKCDRTPENALDLCTKRYDDIAAEFPGKYVIADLEKSAIVAVGNRREELITFARHELELEVGKFAVVCTMNNDPVATHEVEFRCLARQGDNQASN